MTVLARKILRVVAEADVIVSEDIVGVIPMKLAERFGHCDRVGRGATIPCVGLPVHIAAEYFVDGVSSENSWWLMEGGKLFRGPGKE